MAERLFKFLRRGAIGPFSGFRWPVPNGVEHPGAWVSAEGPLEPCVTGIHVCRAAELPYWLHDELWEVDVEGERIEHLEKLVVEHARLRGRVDRWPEAAVAFAEGCAHVVRDLAVHELNLAADPEAARLAGDDLGQVAKQARMLSDEARPERSATAVRLIGLLADAGEIALGHVEHGATVAARETAYIAAYTSDRATPEPRRRLPPGITPFRLERERQANWLSRELDLG